MSNQRTGNSIHVEIQPLLTILLYWLWRPRKLDHIFGKELVKNLSKAHAIGSCQWSRMSVSLKLLWGCMVFLKTSSTNYLLLMFKLIEKSPIENQWLVNMWTEGSTESVSLLRAKWGGGLSKMTPWGFPHQSWDVILLPCFSLPFFPWAIYSLFLPSVWGGHTISSFSLHFI